jgi:HEAT repeat protein
VANLITDDPLKRALEAAQQGSWDVVQQSLGQAEANATARSPDDFVAALDEILAIALHTLQEGDFQDRWEVAKGFSALGERAIAPLVEVLQDEEGDPDVRWFAARMLGDLQRPAALVALVELLKQSADLELCAMAANALSSFGDAAIPGLTELLINSATRLTAVRALSAMQSEQVVTPLLSVVADDNAEVRAIAVEALGCVQESRVPQVLVQALQDFNAGVRKAAIKGLGSCADRLSDPVALLHPLLGDDDLSVAQQAAIALGRLGTPTAATALAQALPTAGLTLQTQIVQSLGWMETPTAMETLYHVLQNDSAVDATVWTEAVAALSRVKTPVLRQRNAQSLIDLLQRDLKTPNATRAIIVALGALGDRAALVPLIEQLANPDAGSRFHIMAALKAIDASAALDRLHTLSSDETCSPLLRQGITFALREW